VPLPVPLLTSWSLSLACRAARGLSNYMFFEAQRLAKEEVQQGNDKFDG
jgi:hypothetical protein